jgi:WD40 repeat protein
VWDEESGVLHRELEGFEGEPVTGLATFLSADGQQPRLVAGSSRGHLRVYDLEAGLVLHTLQGHMGLITDLACIASSSAAPHHPRLVSASDGGTAKVSDGETGEMLADLGGGGGPVTSVAVWKEHTGGHDRIASTSTTVRVWDGEALTLLHDLVCGDDDSAVDLGVLESAEGSHRLLVQHSYGRGLQVFDPEEGRLLHGHITLQRGLPLIHWHLFESAQGRHLLAVLRNAYYHPNHPGDERRTFLDVWDLGEAPPAEVRMRPAHHTG